MKVRTGFVSNSSSSSFVAVGFLFNKKEIKDALDSMYDDEKYDEESIHIYDGDEGGMKNGEVVIGKELYLVDEDGGLISEERHTLEDLNVITDRVKEFLSTYNLVTNKPKLFGGTRMS